MAQAGTTGAAQAKRPFLTAGQAEELAARFGTPLYVYDEASIRARARALNQAFSWNPGFVEYFAVKATPNPTVVSILAEEGCGCDCATGPELLLAQACGVTGRKVMLSSNDTTVADFRLARDLGVLVNFDGPDMPAFWEANVGALPRTVCCRVNPGGTFEGASGFIGTPQDAKFGMTVAQLADTFRYLRDHGVEEFGIHAFLASNTLGGDYYPQLARTLFTLVNQVSDELGIHVGLVDLSGGVGIAYDPADAGLENDIASVGEGVRQAFDEVLVPAGHGDLALSAELGRWLLAPAGGLVTRVLHEKETYHHYLGVDACAANLMRPAIYGAYHHISVLGHEGEPAAGRYSVVGGLCENSDQFAIDRPLPEVHPGDLLFIHDVGAHGHSMGYNYNGKLRSAEVLVHEDGTPELIRRAERPTDYFATLDATELGKRVLALAGAWQEGDGSLSLGQTGTCKPATKLSGDPKRKL